MKLAQPDETWKRFLAWALFAVEIAIWYVAIGLAVITFFSGDDDWQLGLVMTPVALLIAFAVRWLRRRWIRFRFRPG